MSRRSLTHKYKVRYREPYGGTEVDLFVLIWTDEDGHIVSVDLVDQHGQAYNTSPIEDVQ